MTLRYAAAGQLREHTTLDHVRLGTDREITVRAEEPDIGENEWLVKLVVLLEVHLTLKVTIARELTGIGLWFIIGTVTLIGDQRPFWNERVRRRVAKVLTFSIRRVGPRFDLCIRNFFTCILGSVDGFNFQVLQALELFESYRYQCVLRR